MKTTVRELFKHEEELARRYRVRKFDTLLQSLRCPACGTEGVHRQTFAGRSYDSVDAVERRMLQHVGAEFEAECSACGHRRLDGDGMHHFFLLYSELRDAHLVVALRLSREDDDRTKVHRRVWIVPVDQDGEMLTEIGDDEDDFWLESHFRAVIADPYADDFAEEFEVFLLDERFRPIALREYADALAEDGHVSDALPIYDASLSENPEQPDLLQRTARLHSVYGDDERAVEFYLEAYEQSSDAEDLASLAYSALRSRRFGVAQIAAERLIADGVEVGFASKVLASLGTAGDIVRWRTAWENLRDAADDAGDRVGAHVARYWVDSLALPIPDWSEHASIDDYRRQLRDALRDDGFDIARPAPVLGWGAAQLDCDIAATDPFGARYVFFIEETLPTAAIRRTLLARARALALGEDWRGARGILLPRQVFPYAMYRYFSDLPDAQLDLETDADTTLVVHDENIATWLWAAERYFGFLADYSVESLDELDRILLRFHDEGFGAIEHPLVCVIASYLREVIRRAVGESVWVDGETPMDPRVLRLPDGGSANVLSRIRRMVRHGSSESVRDFVVALIELVRTNLATGAQE